MNYNYTYNKDIKTRLRGAGIKYQELADKTNYSIQHIKRILTRPMSLRQRLLIESAIRDIVAERKEGCAI